MFQQLFWHPRFRVHLKHSFFKSRNTSRDLNLTKSVLRLETAGAINVQINSSAVDTILCYEYLVNTQVQMLKSFHSLLMDKVQCVSSGNILPEFFSSPLYVHEFFSARWSCARICFLCIRTCRVFFFHKYPTSPPPPPPSEK